MTGVESTSLIEVNSLYIILVACFWISFICVFIGVILLKMINKEEDGLILPVGTIIMSVCGVILFGVGIVTSNDPTALEQGPIYCFLRICAYLGSFFGIG
jgi:hypothetical protein